MSYQCLEEKVSLPYITLLHSYFQTDLDLDQKFS
jgi:hypothetical protein